jgi:hypothetical protein
MARNHVAAGFVCVLEGAIATRSHVLACRQAVAPHPLHLDAGYDSAKTRDELAGRGMTGQIAHIADDDHRSDRYRRLMGHARTDLNFLIAPDALRRPRLSPSSVTWYLR